MLKVNRHQGFTLLELVLVIAMLVILATLSRSLYANYQKNVELEVAAKTLVSDLRRARDKAMNGESDRNWGAHLVNGAADYYEIFSSPTNYVDGAKTVVDTVYLQNIVTFSSPTTSSSMDIVFNKVSATSTATSTVLISPFSSKTISVTVNGAIN